jgi:hypothetical protein
MRVNKPPGEQSDSYDGCRDFADGGGGTEFYVQTSMHRSDLKLLHKLLNDSPSLVLNHKPTPAQDRSPQADACQPGSRLPPQAMG